MSGLPLEGQVALVTGGAKRIGRSIVLRLAADGAAVVVNYAHSRAEAEDLVSQLTARGGRATAWRADVSRQAEVREMFGAVEKEFGRLDLLVNNAGVFFRAKLAELSEEEWDKVQGINLKGQFFCAQAAAELMKRQGHGRIVNISSIGGLLAWPSYMHYCVSKAGVIMLTRCLARALAPEIMVNSVAPGTIQFPGEPLKEERARMTPLGRNGTGEDVASAVAFLAQAEFITGQVLVVDGGRTATA